MFIATEEVYSQNAFCFGGTHEANLIISVHRQNYGVPIVSDGKFKLSKQQH